MNKYYLLLLKFLFVVAVLINEGNLIYADCTFNVINYSNVPVKVQAGFSNSGDSLVTFSVAAANNKKITVSSPYNCKSTSNAMLGLAYVKLVGSNSSGGFIYSPLGDIIKARGGDNLTYITANSATGSSNGIMLSLINNYKPQSDLFTATIQQANRNLSKPSSLR